MANWEIGDGVGVWTYSDDALSSDVLILLSYGRLFWFPCNDVVNELDKLEPKYDVEKPADGCLWLFIIPCWVDWGGDVARSEIGDGVGVLTYSDDELSSGVLSLLP